MEWPFFKTPAWFLTIFVRDGKSKLRDSSLANALMYIFIDCSFDPEEKVLAWSILPDHIHLLVRSHEPETFMNYLRKEVSSFFPKLLEWPFEKKFISESEEIMATFLLLHGEPLILGYADDPLDYSFTSYHDYVRRFGLPFDMFFRTHRPLQTVKPRSWLSSCVFSSSDASSGFFSLP